MFLGYEIAGSIFKSNEQLFLSYHKMKLTVFEIQMTPVLVD